MSWIAYVGPFEFPWGQAASRRVYGNARAMVATGRDVVVVSGSEVSGSAMPTPIDCSDGKLYHVGLGIRPDQRDSELVKAAKVLFWSCRAVIRWLDSQPSRPSHVILYGGYASYVAFLLPWCRRNSVALVVDVVEWYEASHLRGGRYGLASLNSEIAMRFLYQRCDGIIAISEYLENYYRARGCRVLRVPPTLDVQSIHPRIDLRSTDPRLTLTYAGEPGRKDLLAEVIRGVVLADGGESTLRMQIVGPTEAQVRQAAGRNANSAVLCARGRLPQPEIAELLRSSDATVLLRPDLRYSRAGFSTKVVESLAQGTPFLGNLTGDLGMYIHDGVEGLVCMEPTAEALASQIRRLLSLSPSEKDGLRAGARRRAESSFDYRTYVRPLDAFLETVSAGRSF